MDTTKVTIRDVAHLAGVSYGTVSRYLNGNVHVSNRAAKQIAEAIEILHYTPNNAARSLAKHHTHLVAFIIQVESKSTIVQPSVSNAMAGANQVLGDNGYQMVILIANSEDSTKRITKLVHSDFADGYLLFSMSNNDSLANTFLDSKRPAVRSELGDSDKLPYPAVDFANRAGQRAITEYMLKKGRERLLYICGPGYSPSSINRLKGFQDAMGERFNPELVYYADDWEIPGGELAVVEFQNHLNTIDGIVCANDNIAVGAINQLNRMGFRVPDDIAVTGFDDSPMALLINPKLTTVHQDSELHGETMANLLLDILNGNPVEDHHFTLLPTSIVERQSA
ncbi:LacI family DNA-binding transcriptional regulator [Bifidobacterium sp. ESL0769]|uniref:LacI family DNA-binding transcriptional regulator n=1 Tax=Bifidobacterium sp. ESL0769 TaxID=2983229 RepID=UPI0023F7A3CF|nr:LacI family DNA-binding transcriptional regulator [Bifidobacterium sp. ESL0769]WEV67449.1 LacI family DNA-binding transcriptional regulator [Bifidobacterium sp. ESL0769]